MLRSSLFVLSLLGVFAAPAYAAGLTASQTVEVAIVAVDANGETKTRFEPAAEISPGDEVRYVLSYANSGDDSAENVRLDMPVPNEIELIDGSVEAAGARVTYSIDNGSSYAARDMLTISANGQARIAVAEDITHIRWTFAEAIAPGQTGTISYRGVLQ